MRIQKYHPRVYIIARIFLGHCPICRTSAQDKRYKDMRTITSCNIYRTSKTSVTMQCKLCGLYFGVTWKSLAGAIAKKADMIAHEIQKADDYAFYLSSYDQLDKYVNIGGTIRMKKKHIESKKYPF